jgi:hypothetical protein
MHLSALADIVRNVDVPISSAYVLITSSIGTTKFTSYRSQLWWCTLILTHVLLETLIYMYIGLSHPRGVIEISSRIWQSKRPCRFSLQGNDIDMGIVIKDRVGNVLGAIPCGGTQHHKIIG